MNNDSLRNIFDEHEVVKKLVGSVSESFGDLDVFFKLQTERFNWTQSSLETLSEKSTQLLQTIDTLWKGLQEHFSAEVTSFPPVFGDNVSRAIFFEHDEIAAAIARVRKLLSSTRFEGLSQRELLASKISLQDEIGKLSGMIEEHARVEDMLFHLVKKAQGKATG